MAKRTDEEIMNYHLQKAEQAKNRIKQKEKRMKEQQRKKENSIKYTMGGLMFKFFGAELMDLSRKEIEAFVNGWDSLFSNNPKNIIVFKEQAQKSLLKYQTEQKKPEKEKSEQETFEQPEDKKETSTNE